MLQEYYPQTPFPNNLRTPAPHLPTPHLNQKQHNEAEGLIYGTTVQVHKVMALIERFILEFQISRKIEDEYVSERIYRIKLNQLPDDESVLFEVEGSHLREFDRELYLQFIYYPAEMISIFDMVLKNLFGRYFVEPQTIDSEKTNREIRQAAIMVGIKGLHEDDVLCVRELGPKNIGKLVMIKAIVIRMSEVFPQMKRAWFRCENCYDEISVPLLNAKVHQPEVCRVCNFRQTMQIIHNFCSFTDKQYIKIQELPELVTEGETPSSLTVISYDTNVDGVRPGDRVSLIGIYRAQPSKIDRMKGTVRSVFNTYLDLISFNLISQDRYSSQKKCVFTDNQKMAFHRFADNENIVDNLVKSFAPSIFGHDNVKLGVLAQLFGGSKKDLPNRGSTRADINVCMVGDPSTAKSQLLQQVHRIAPRSVYTSGRGSSAVGLTCSVRKDPDSGEFVLQSGALVLADQGICCIDQFDKMQENSRTILLEAMEQQTISIAKAGIVCQLNSRTAILAAANPVGSKYNTRKSVVENINLPPSILSRFDLIYILLDLANEASDTRLATHILDFYMSGRTQKVFQGPLNLKQLTRYITYAREYVTPILTKEAGKKLQQEYVSMRLKGMTSKTITATPRQLQSLIRMSEAFARMKLSSQANEEDVERAVQLIQNATLSAATNLETGIIDMDIITTGRSSMAKRRILEIANIIRQFLFANQSKYRKPCTVERLVADFNAFHNHKKLQIQVQDFIEGIKILQSDELLIIFGQNKNNPSFKLQINSED